MTDIRAKVSYLNGQSEAWIRVELHSIIFTNIIMAWRRQDSKHIDSVRNCLDQHGFSWPPVYAISTLADLADNVYLPRRHTEQDSPTSSAGSGTVIETYSERQDLRSDEVPDHVHEHTVIFYRRVIAMFYGAWDRKDHATLRGIRSFFKEMKYDYHFVEKADVSAVIELLGIDLNFSQENVLVVEWAWPQIKQES